MKKILLLVLLFTNIYFLKAQSEIQKNVFLYKDPGVSSINIETIILLHQDADLVNEFADIFESKGYKVIKYFDLFPPIREYTNDQINSKLSGIKFDAFVTIQFKSIDERAYSTGSGSLLTGNVAVYSNAEKTYVKELTLSIAFAKSINIDPWFIIESKEKGGSTISTIKRVSKHALEKAINAIEKEKLII